MRTHVHILTLCLCVLTVGVHGQPSVVPSGNNSVQLRAQKVDVKALRAQAKALSEKGKKKPDSKEARDASVEEVEVLIKLAFTKDVELGARKRQLVEKLKNDESVSRATRFRLVGASANIEISTDQTLDPDQKMAAYAKVAWHLVREFPDRSEGFASLLRIARDSNDAQAMKIVEALVLSKATDDIKEAALQLHERLRLVGQSLAEVAGDALWIPEEPGPMCIFTWSVKRSGSIALADRLKQDLPSDTLLVGICLEDDTVEARNLAATQGTSAQWVFPTGGCDSVLCQRLVLNESTVYLVSEKGKISTVSGLNKLATERRKKTKEGRK